MSPLILNIGLFLWFFFFNADKALRDGGDSFGGGGLAFLGSPWGGGGSCLPVGGVQRLGSLLGRRGGSWMPGGAPRCLSSPLGGGSQVPPGWGVPLPWGGDTHTGRGPLCVGGGCRGVQTPPAPQGTPVMEPPPPAIGGLGGEGGVPACCSAGPAPAAGLGQLFLVSYRFFPL